MAASFTKDSFVKNPHSRFSSFNKRENKFTYKQQAQSTKSLAI